jgi:hypothetical protein
MLQNEHTFRNILYEIQQNGGIDLGIAFKIDEILVSIDKRTKMDKYLYKLIEKIDFYKLFYWEKIEVKEEKIEHFIELDGISIHFSNKDSYYYLVSTLLNSFFSNLWSEINLSCIVLSFLFRFPKKKKDPPYPRDVRDRLNRSLPTHELTDLFKEEYSNNPKSWLYSLRELRNDFHHSRIDIRKIIPEPEFDTLVTFSKYEGPFFINKKYFGSSVPEEKREVNFFCNEVLKKTEWFLSEIYRILSDDLKARNCVPLYDLRQL